MSGSCKVFSGLMETSLHPQHYRRIPITSFNSSWRQYSKSREQFQRQQSLRENTSHELREEIKDWLQESHRLENDICKATTHSHQETFDITRIRAHKMKKPIVRKAQVGGVENIMSARTEKDISNLPVYSWRTQKNKWTTRILYCNAVRSPNTMHKVMAKMKDLPAIAIATNPSKDTWLCASNDFILSCPADHELCSQIARELLGNKQILKVGYERLAREVGPLAEHEPTPYLSLLSLANLIAGEQPIGKSSLRELVAQYLAKSLPADLKRPMTSSMDSKQANRVSDGRQMSAMMKSKTHESLKHESKISACENCHSQELNLDNVHVLIKLFLAMDTKRLYLKDTPELPISGVISK